MSTRKALKQIVSRIHADQRGSVSLETILIIAAIALPILIYTLKFGWPKVREYFMNGMTDLDVESNNVINGAGQ